MNARSFFWAGMWVMAGLSAILPNARAARVLDQCDVDSLVYDSEVIVRGVIGDSTLVKTPDGDVQVLEVKVTEAVQGALKVGQVIRVTGMEDYRKSPGMKAAGEMWGETSRGDEVVLLLAKGRAMYSNYEKA